VITGDDALFWATQRDRMLAMLAQGHVEVLAAQIHAAGATGRTLRLVLAEAIGGLLAAPPLATEPDPECVADVECLTIAAQGAVQDFTDVRIRGYLKEDPASVLYRLALLVPVLAVVRAAAHREAASGEWGDPADQLGSPQQNHRDQVDLYRARSCNCEWCLRGGLEPTS
jgi:hypothetical protein